MSEAQLNTVYLVDLENIGTKILYQHVGDHRNVEYIIFHSDSTTAPGTILDNIPADVKVSFVDCRSGGNNAMDFCICTMAGILAAEGRQMIRILSDDKGYDPILYMLHHRGVRIIRESTYQAVPKQADSHKPDQSYRENLPIIKAIRATVPKRYQEEVIGVLPGAVSRKEAHEMLQAILPAPAVADIYKKLKKHIPKEVV